MLHVFSLLIIPKAHYNQGTCRMPECKMQDAYHTLAKRTCFGGHHQVSLPGGIGVGLQVSKFDQVASDDRKMSVAG